MTDKKATTYIDDFSSTLAQALNAGSSQMYLPQADVDELATLVNQYTNDLGIYLTLDDGAGNFEVCQCYSTHGQASGYVSVFRDVFNQNGVDGTGLTWASGTEVEARLTAGQMRLLDNDRLAMHTVNPASGAVTIYGEYANHRAAHLVLSGDIAITLRVDGEDPDGGLWKRTIVLQQDATGGHAVTSWTNVVWPGGVAPIGHPVRSRESQAKCHWVIVVGCWSTRVISDTHTNEQDDNLAPNVTAKEDRLWIAYNLQGAALLGMVNSAIALMAKHQNPLHR